MPDVSVVLAPTEPNSSVVFPVVGGNFKMPSLSDNMHWKLPPWNGSGYIAGETPDGLVMFNGSPAVRTLDLFDRETRIAVASTTSASDGTYRFNGVSVTRVFDVRARGIDANENDLIAARVMAAT